MHFFASLEFDFFRGQLKFALKIRSLEKTYIVGSRKFGGEVFAFLLKLAQ